MIDYSGLEQVVVLFDTQAQTVVEQLRFDGFERLVAREKALEAFAASTVKAGFAIVGSGLAVRGIILFHFEVDEDGFITDTFNVPLEYIMQHAGSGPDLGNGAIHYASRHQCPVPWQVQNLWESEATGEDHPTMLLQKSVWRNRIGLKPARDIASAVSEFEDMEVAAQAETLQRQLTETLGEEGRLSVQQLVKQHKEQFVIAKQRFRTEMERQQRSYLERMRQLRDEVHRLKAALRTEEDRCRQLQELMRRAS